METPMQSWNDDRLDELNRRVELCATKKEMNLRFDAVDRQFDEVNKRLDRIGSRLDRIMYVFMATGLGLGLTALLDSFR